MRPAFVCAVATVAAVVTALAEEFPLTFESPRLITPVEP
jgi:hypothetical protein